MKYGLMILRADGSFDFYSRLSTLHELEKIPFSYQYFQRQLKKKGFLCFDNGNTVFRKPIQR